MSTAHGIRFNAAPFFLSRSKWLLSQQSRASRKIQVSEAKMPQLQQSLKRQTYHEARVDNDSILVVKAYPVEIQLRLQKIRRGYVLRMAIDFVEMAVDLTTKEIHVSPADRRGAMDDDGVPSKQSRARDSRVRLEALATLAGDAVFLRRLGREVDRIVAQEHLTSIGADRGPDWTPGRSSVPTRAGTWKVPSSVGLDSAQELEGKPEGLSVALARRIVDAGSRADGDDGDLSLGASAADVSVSVLDWGSGYRRALGRAIDAVAPPGSSVRVVEVDVVGARSQLDVLCVQGRYSRVGDIPRDRRPFDTVVLAMPSPAERSASRHREAYKDPEGCHRERKLLDVGRRGPTKWNRELRRRLRALPGLLKRGGEAVLVLPKSVRLANTYRDHPSLLDGAEDVLDRLGLTVALRFDLVEEHPVAMPYVVRNRPARVVWFVRWKEAA